MNREIKFRAWHNIEKEMREVAMLRWEDGRMSRIAGYWKETRNNGWTDHDPLEGKYVLMQYTGLKDKNGKEIYEGDVLKWKYVNDNGYRRREFVTIFSVFYNEGTAEYKTSDGDSLYTCLNDSIEVIGNIYENPELITNL